MKEERGKKNRHYYFHDKLELRTVHTTIVANNTKGQKNRGG